MKKLISTLASIPFSVLAQQFPEAPMCFYVLKNVVSALIAQRDYKTLLAMDLKTHACMFNCKKPIIITKVGYRAWKPGITYRISLWEYGKDLPLATCLVTPENTGEIQFFSLKHPVNAHPDADYYISRTYICGGPHHNITDYVGWLSNKGSTSVYPFKDNVITLSAGLFSDDANPLLSDNVSNITTNSLLPLIDFEYNLQYQ